MAVQSIIQIKVDDSAFKAFVDKFKKYQQEVRGSTKQWGAVGKTIQSFAKDVMMFAAKIAETGKAFGQANTAAGKIGVSLKAADRVMSSLARSSRGVAVSLKDATTSLLKWGSLTGLFSGLLGAGGLFGIAHLADKVSSGQTAARRTGNSYGAEKASEMAYGQLLGGEGGVQSLMEQIATAKTRMGMLTDKVSFQSLGVKDWQNKSSSQLMPELLKAIQGRYTSVPKEVRGLYAESTGLNQVSGMGGGGLMALAATNIDAIEKQKRANESQLSLSERTQTAWANLKRTLDAAGEKIETVFVTALTPLLPALTNFSNALVGGIRNIAQNPHMKDWIKSAGDAITDFSKYLTTSKFKEDIDWFMDGIDQLAGAAYSVAQKIFKVFNLFGEKSLTPREMQKATALKSMDYGAAGFGLNMSEDYRQSRMGKEGAASRFLEDIRKIGNVKGEVSAANAALGTNWSSREEAQRLASTVNRVEVAVRVIETPGGNFQLIAAKSQ